MKTLIRAHFTPFWTTGQRYIVTGSADPRGGSIYIYDVLTGHPVSILEGHRSLVRDVSCHPYSPDIVSASVGLLERERGERGRGGSIIIIIFMRKAK